MGETITRAQLSEAIYQEVGLSRNESADLLEMVLSEITQAHQEEATDSPEILDLYITLDPGSAMVVPSTARGQRVAARNSLRVALALTPGHAPASEERLTALERAP